MPLFPKQPARTRRIGGANAALTTSSPPVTSDKRTWLAAVYVTYSANVSLDATVTINSGVVAAFDVLLSTLTFVANRYGVYLPEQRIPLAVGDVIDVSTPAGGAGITAAVEIKFEHEYPVPDIVGRYEAERAEGRV